MKRTNASIPALHLVAACAAFTACGGAAGNGSSQPTSKLDDPSEAKEDPPDLTGQALANSLLAQWQRDHEDRDWQEEVRSAHPNIPGSADNSAMVYVKGGQDEGQTYGRFSAQEVLTWKLETDALVLAGARIFHSGDELGTSVGVSCDMCHPDAANTHPATYPKFQVQLGRTILLRDMINWCLINPVRAPAMEPDDPRMRALEAYIFAQSKGEALDYGKH